MSKEKHKIVLIGGGFAGLEFIKDIQNHDVYEVILVDINNYNFFPPLIYQVATGFMEPSAISYPFRKILRGKRNIRFRLGTLNEVVPSENKVILNNGELHYDSLIMATGAKTNFFGNKSIAEHSLPMKTISDALALRNVIFTRLDRATRVDDHEERKKLLTFVIAGAGPTGVELSGIIAEMRHYILLKDYPELSENDLGEIYLIDGQDAVLAPMSKKSQQYTYDKLVDLGVKIQLGKIVKDFVDGVVYLSDGTTISSENMIWAAGVTARTFPGFQKESIGRGNRLLTDRLNRVDGYDNIYALGDCAFIQGDQDYPMGHPQLAQPAMQQAKNLAANFKRGKDWKPFEYKDLGSLAIIGRNKAVMDGPNLKYFVKGFPAWLIWLFVHIMGLVNFRNKLKALYNWLGYYIYKDQSFRMIIKPAKRVDEQAKV